MKQKKAHKLIFLFLLIFCFSDTHCSSLQNSISLDAKVDNLMPLISPTGNPQPLYPLLAPSPMSPFTITNDTAPKLSGLCTLDFDAIDTMMSMTAIDCFTVFAPYLANVVCCPQFEATLVILIGQSSKKTKSLSVNSTLAKHCLSDYEQILMGQGANNSLQHICAIGPSNLTEASCPVKDVDGFEKIVNTSKILANCGKIDLVNECCQETCQNALTEAAKDLASVSSYEFDAVGIRHPSDISNRVVKDCKNIVLRWLASKLEPVRAKEVLRGLATCNLNKVCPLVLPNVGPVARGCGDDISNQTSCCTAMEESGCLLPSLPSDATFDRYSGVSFLCDLNDHIPAPWPSMSHLPTSSCNKTIKIPALPAAASGQRGLYNDEVRFLLLYVMTFVLVTIL
ncbi:hypothetical protein M8C21_032069 [Ambrosia artemisiifolia]|uniref:SPARK domain-containing protein n=1 Tax=Ambrosia artemisiifolia TaxID=4212 RepID=A0AAD5CZX9_AMBAR|nr:hypothetical protein M8C21_032069 [Ambrosia artemisiifolia]